MPERNGGRLLGRVQHLNSYVGPSLASWQPGRPVAVGVSAAALLHVDVSVRHQVSVQTLQLHRAVAEARLPAARARVLQTRCHFLVPEIAEWKHKRAWPMGREAGLVIRVLPPPPAKRTRF